MIKKKLLFFIVFLIFQTTLPVIITNLHSFFKKNLSNPFTWIKTGTLCAALVGIKILYPRLKEYNTYLQETSSFKNIWHMLIQKACGISYLETEPGNSLKKSIYAKTPFRLVKYETTEEQEEKILNFKDDYAFCINYNDTPPSRDGGSSFSDFFSKREYLSFSPCIKKGHLTISYPTYIRKLFFICKSGEKKISLKLAKLDKNKELDYNTENSFFISKIYQTKENIFINLSYKIPSEGLPKDQSFPKDMYMGYICLNLSFSQITSSLKKGLHIFSEDQNEDSETTNLTVYSESLEELLEPLPQAQTISGSYEERVKNAVIESMKSFREELVAAKTDKIHIQKKRRPPVEKNIKKSSFWSRFFGNIFYRKYSKRTSP